jgi:hypothetical protein
MSLINDALKRAKESQRKNTPSGGAPLRPVEVREEERDYSWILPVIVILMIVVAVFFIALSAAKHTVKDIVAAPETSPTQEVESVSPPVPTVPPTVIGPAAISNNYLPKPTRVQGIFYDPVHPWAIVSGKTVYVGDAVDGMSVAEITRNSITFIGNGQTNKLLVGQQ